MHNYMVWGRSNSIASSKFYVLVERIPGSQPSSKMHKFSHNIPSIVLIKAFDKDEIKYTSTGRYVYFTHEVEINMHENFKGLEFFN